MWRAAAAPGRLLRSLMRLALTLVLLAVAGGTVLAWRLSQGPLDVAWLARRIESAANPEGSPTRLHIGAASIRWEGFHQGADHGLELRLQDLRVVNPAGAPGAELAEADVSLSMGRLLALQLVPRSVVLSGLRLRALRAEDGSITFDIGTLNDAASAPGDAPAGDPGPSVAQTMAELRRPAGTDRSVGNALANLAQLRHVRIRGATIEFLDRQLVGTLLATVDELDIERQPAGGVRGAATGRLTLGDATAALGLQADLAAGGGTHIEATLAPLGTASLAKADPALAGIGVLDAALQGRATLDLSPSLRPRAAELRATAGAGRLAFRGGAVPFESLALDAEAAWPDASWTRADWIQQMRPSRLQLRRLQAVLASPGGGWPSTVGLSGEATRQAGQIAGRFEATLDHAAFADLPALWPAAWGGNVRPWLTQNITAGMARDGAVRVAIEAPDSLASIKVTQAGGTLLGDDVTIHWMRPVPPIEHAQAVLTVLNPDVLEIAVPSARQGAVTVKDGLIRINGLSVKDQVLALAADVAGPVPEVLTVLRHPRLKLLDRHPIPMRNPAGTLAGKITVDLPLEHDLDFDQVKIHALGRVSGLRLGGLVAGRDLENGDIQMDVTTEAMKASGAAVVGGIPGTIGVEMDFRNGLPSQVVQRATLTGRATLRQLITAGIDPAGLITGGTAGVSATYTAQRDGQSEVRVAADFKDAALALAGWTKPPGPAADASAQLLLRQDRLVGITAIQAQGPGMQVVGRAEMVGDRPGILRLDRVVLGSTQASGEIRFPAAPAEPIRARLTGPVLDLSTELSGKPSRGVPQPRERGPPWVADVRFDRVLVGRDRGIAAVTAHAEHDGQRLAVLRAESAGPERVQAVIVPQGNGRKVNLWAADGGALLRLLDLMDTVHGGRLALEGRYDDTQPDPPFSGTLDLSDFQLRDAPSIGKLLQAVTVYGIADALRGPGLAFSRLHMPFRYGGDAFEIGEARAFSSSLGVTAQGRIDTGRKTVDVTGTIVPAYALNSALGNIPLLGRLFSLERGGGLVAVNYTVRGAVADPTIVVNPLSALTPGFLRGLFKIFE